MAALASSPILRSFIRFTFYFERSSASPRLGERDLTNTCCSEGISINSAAFAAPVEASGAQADEALFSTQMS